MSRLSRANLKARESVFAGGPELYRGDIQAICPPNLEECVMAMEDCCEEAFEAQQLLRNGTRDLPRMSKILESQRVFLLIDEGTVKKYKADLVDEIEPAINELIERAEQGLKALSKKESALQTKVDSARSRPLRPTATTGPQKLEARRLQILSKQRERLEEELKALESEVEALKLKVLNS
ncbi:DASH complex subunit SPC19 [Hypsizygus marmoreus]|uniref:DASH complex subunit SPC19 n=1 Tax=Hypsizygus marmoreus TaxID=39966 RepID=A0A369JDR7_HYPMA|nr:DASH complex subunit SPC19 [Hypsizygus marmoreus]